MGLTSGISASRLGQKPQGWDMGLEVGGKGDTKEKKKEEEKIPHMYESIGHQPLWGRWPKGCLSDSVL